MSDEYEIIFKVGSMLAVFIGIFVSVLAIVKNTSKHKQEIAEKIFLSNNISETHDYLIERNFFALHGLNATSDEIKYLLEKKNPFNKIMKYKSGNEYLRTILDEFGNITRIEIKPIFKIHYWKFVSLGIFVYGLLFYAAFAPRIFLDAVLNSVDLSGIYIFFLLALIWFSLFMACAIITVKCVKGLFDAKSLSSELNPTQSTS